MGGTRGSGILSSAADVHEMRGVGGMCEMCKCLDRGGVVGDGDNWITGLGFTNPVATGGGGGVGCVSGLQWYRWGVGRGLVLCT